MLRAQIRQLSIDTMALEAQHISTLAKQFSQNKHQGQLRLMRSREPCNSSRDGSSPDQRDEILKVRAEVHSILAFFFPAEFKGLPADIVSANPILAKLSLPRRSSGL